MYKAFALIKLIGRGRHTISKYMNKIMILDGDKCYEGNDLESD